MSNQWLSFFYQYGVGGIVFSLSLWGIIEHDVLNFSKKIDKHIFYLMLCGFVSFLLVHGIWVYLVLN